jgi:thiol-disulfide isomerase/thioredoxin
MTSDGFCRTWSLASAIVALFALAWAGQSDAAPINDNFANATALFGVTNITISNADATVEQGETSHAGEPTESTLWWKWTAPFTGTFNVTTSNSVATSGLPLDTVVAVYVGNSVSNLTYVLANDDTTAGEYGATWSRCVFRAYAGETLMIAAGSLGATGTIRLSVNQTDKFMYPWSSEGLNHSTVQSASFSGQLLMIDFWETTCVACIEELPALIRVQNTFSSRGFTIIGLSGDPNITLVENYLAGRGINYPIAMGTVAIQNDLGGGLVGYPTKFFVDPDNRVVGLFTGGNTEKGYRLLIEPLLRADSRLRATIARNNGNVTIRWPSMATGYVVESSGHPGGGLWSDVGIAPTVVNGENVVTVPASTNAQFFRLKKP